MTIDDQIEWVLDHPGFSERVRKALFLFMDADPLTAWNEVELLRLLIARRSSGLIGAELDSPSG